LPLRSLPRRLVRRATPVAFALAAVATAAATSGAQVTAVDEGSFTVTRQGARIGREEFRIVRQPAAGGSAYMARATAVYGDRRVAPALQTDGEGVPERYQVEVRRGGSVEQRVSAQVAGTHFRAQTVSDVGEAAREFILEPGTVVIDDEVYHQYFFLVRRAARSGGGVAVLAPRRGTQGVVAISLERTERITIGGQSLQARHYVLNDRVGGRREVWADEQGRVLRVTVPGEGLDVVRDDPPR
jgi:hypothetical protein